MIISIAQKNPIVGNLEYNFQQVVESVKQFPLAHIIVFPELFLIGYPPLDLLFRSEFIKKVENYHKKIKELSKTTSSTLIIGSILPSSHTNLCYNSALVFNQGKLLLTYHKKNLPQNNIFDERRYFLPGPINQKGLFSSHKIDYQVCICADLWFNSFFAKDVDYDTEVIPFKTNSQWIINLSASPFEKGKPLKRIEEAKKKLKDTQKGLIFVNQWGGHDGVLFDGSSFILDNNQQILFQADSFKNNTTCFSKKHIKKEQIPLQDPLKLLYKALVTGIKDYFKKTGFSKAVIGLSGGIDSALVACLAVEALGPHNIETWTLPSPFSSQGSIDDSINLAKNLKVSCHIKNIEYIIEAFEQNISFKKGDLTHQNIQARIRGTFLMAQANLKTALVLATGNKSELAVGYSTLYGDMNGALLPIGDLYKTEVYQLSAWINNQKEIIPSSILTKEPSAELAPEQKDTDNLPPYEILDPFLHQYLDLKQDSVQIEGAPSLTQKVIKMIQRSEFKRYQSAPILRVSSYCLGMGRRILLSSQAT